MKKAQFLKFWKAIADSTNGKETISTFESRKGYGGRRTLERCSQAASGFKEGLSSDIIAGKTGWSARYINKIRGWWEESFPSYTPRTVVSWSMKEAIGEFASKVGPNPEAIIIDLARLCRKGKRLEGELPPDPGTVAEIIKEIERRDLEKKKNYEAMLNNLRNV